MNSAPLCSVKIGSSTTFYHILPQKVFHKIKSPQMQSKMSFYEAYNVGKSDLKKTLRSVDRSV